MQFKFSKMNKPNPLPGFTLAELLTVLAVLGVMASFTIPKVLIAQQTQHWNITLKEDASIVAGAFSAYQKDNLVASTFSSANITPYISYVKVDSTSQIDNIVAWGTLDCSNPGHICLKLHNGSMMLVRPGEQLGGTGANNAVSVFFDPDGRVTAGSNWDDGISIGFTLFANGRLTTRGSPLSDTAVNTWYNPFGSCVVCDPAWFSWN